MGSLDDAVDRHLAEEKRANRAAAEKAASARARINQAADEFIGLLEELADYLYRKTAAATPPPAKKRWWSTIPKPKDEFVLQRVNRGNSSSTLYLRPGPTLHAIGRNLGNDFSVDIDIRGLFAKGQPLGIGDFIFSCEAFTGKLKAIDLKRGGLDSDYATPKVDPRDAMAEIAAKALPLNR